jgi:hypothetical protein
VQPNAFGLVDHAHTPAAQFLDDAVMGDGLSIECVRTRHVPAILWREEPASQRTPKRCRRKMRMSGLCKVEMSAFMLHAVYKQLTL